MAPLFRACRVIKFKNGNGVITIKSGGKTLLTATKLLTPGPLVVVIKVAGGGAVHVQFCCGCRDCACSACVASGLVSLRAVPEDPPPLPTHRARSMCTVTVTVLP